MEMSSVSPEKVANCFTAMSPLRHRTTVRGGAQSQGHQNQVLMLSRRGEESGKEGKGETVLLCRLSHERAEPLAAPWGAEEAPSSSRHRSCLAWESLRSTVTPFPFRVTSFLLQSFSR